MEFKSYMFSRIVAALVVVMLSGFAWADNSAEPQEPTLDLSKSYQAFNDFEKKCGTPEAFKTEKCYLLHKQVMRDFWQTVAGE